MLFLQELIGATEAKCKVMTLNITQKLEIAELKRSLGLLCPDYIDSIPHFAMNMERNTQGNATRRRVVAVEKKQKKGGRKVRNPRNERKLKLRKHVSCREALKMQRKGTTKTGASPPPPIEVADNRLVVDISISRHCSNEKRSVQLNYDVLDTVAASFRFKRFECERVIGTTIH